MSRIDALLDGIGRLITQHPKRVVLVFLVLTAVFALGLTDIESEEGTQEFAEGVPAFEANEEIDERFSDTRTGETTSLQIIHRDEDVLTPAALERNLRVQEQIQADPSIQAESTTSIAGAVAMTIDPTAETPGEQRQVLAQTPDAEIEEATASLLADSPGLVDLLGNDYNPESPSSTAALTILELDGDEMAIQQRAERVSDTVEGEYMMFSDGLMNEEFDNVIADSMLIVVPAVVVMILLFLLVAYRDPIDLLLGLTALSMTVVWTFGFTGLVGIPFSEMMIAIPPLLLAIGVDFGIHAVNRYREERVRGHDIIDGMDAATDQLLVAFFIVGGTTVIGFGANVVSDLGPIAEFGLVAGLGVLFTFLVFGIFMPAAKVLLDQFRTTHNVPDFGNAPLGSEDSLLGRVLPTGAIIGRRAPVAILLAAAVLTAGAGAMALTVDTSFDDDDFLPPEELPDGIEQLPEPFAPAEYTFTEIVNYLDSTFESGEDDQVSVYVEGPMHADGALESIHRAGEEPPGTVLSAEGNAETDSIIDIIHDYADEDEQFRQLVETSDTTGSGVPDQNLEPIYAELFASEYGDQARDYLTEDLRYALVIYDVEAGAADEQIVGDIDAIADDYRFEATPAGGIVVYQQVGDRIYDSAVDGLVVALVLTAIFLMLVYRVLEGYATLGLANMVPIGITVALLVGTMPLIGIPLNAMTATALSITIGVGVAYSVHITHRFIDEFTGDGYQALLTTLRGTGGALTGSMLTTLSGAAALILAIIPILGQFGILMSISVFYSFVTAILFLPPTLLLWERYIA